MGRPKIPLFSQYMAGTFYFQAIKFQRSMTSKNIRRGRIRETEFPLGFRKRIEKEKKNGIQREMGLNT